MIPGQFVGDSWTPDNTDDLLAWLRMMTWTSRRHTSAQEFSDSLEQISSPVQDLAHLPILATRLNAELVRLCKLTRLPLSPLVPNATCFH